MTKKEIQAKIENLEAHYSGVKRISGGYVVAKNIKINKKKDIAEATIHIFWGDEGKEEIYRNCEYKLSKL